MKHFILPHLYQAVAEGAMFGIVVFEKKSRECLFINHMGIEMLGSETPSIQSLIPTTDKPPFRSFSEDLLLHDGLYHDIIINTVSGSFIGNVGIRVLEV